ncbi:PPE domain-containing protein [Actinocrispum sp. NPDC049592]|uniref:PPE domain-containing protein n=1 Tax=Actinocrispum sp. NPDC049592 TaxID=3154835 RepID=UPI003424EC70
MTDTRWRGLDHKAIYTMINDGPGPAASASHIQFWTTLSQGLDHISSTLDSRLGKLKVDWEGQAGDNATTSMSPLKDWATHASQGANVMKASYEMQGDYVGQARSEVPEPVEVTTPKPSTWAMIGAGAAALAGNPGPAAAVANQAIDHEAQERAQDEAARKAVQAMEKYEDNSQLNASTLGRFDPPPNVVVNTPGAQGGWETGSVNTSGFHSSSAFPAGHTTPATQTFTPSHTTTNNTTFTPSHTPTPTGDPLPTGQHQATDPSHVTPPVVEPPVNRPLPFPPNPPTPTPNPNPLPITGGPGPFFTGGPGGSGPNGSGPFNEGPGGRGGQGGPGGGGRGGLGNQGFGQNAVDAEGRQLGRGAGTNALFQEGVGGRGGAAGNMAGGRGGAANGPMGAGGRGQGEDDDEHETPSYLLETEDVFGDDRMVAPPVIGESSEQ